MAHTVSPRDLSAESPVRYQGNPCDIYGEQSGTGTGFSPSTSVSLVNIIPPVLDSFAYLTLTLYQLAIYSTLK